MPGSRVSIANAVLPVTLSGMSNRAAGWPKRVQSAGSLSGGFSGMSSVAASAATAPKLSCRWVGVWVMRLFAATHSATGTPQRRAAAVVSISRAAAPAVRKYSWLSRIDRLPPVSMVRKIRLRRRCSLVDAYSAWTLSQSQPSSSATSMGRPVKLPWPISTRATRMMMVSSGRIRTQAVTSGLVCT